MIARLMVIAASIAAVTAFARPTPLIHAFEKTTLDSVYTAAQAKHGESLYTASCARCHAANLAGTDSASPLAGKDFLGGWTGMTLDQLFKKTYETMPSDNPKTVPQKDIIDIIAYMLSRNEYPAGAATLTDSLETLKAIKIVAPH